jgi:histidine ammonia-lyase
MILVGNRLLALNDFYKILFEEANVGLDTKALENVKSSHVFLQKFSEGKVIYGINTGFGPMAQYKISAKDTETLQYNLIRSHSSGSGPLLQDIYIKAIMIARLNTFMIGYSGVHETIVELLKDLINKNIFPNIPERGGVGASGDLVQLAHLALVLIGEGEVSFNGKNSPTAQILKENNLSPLAIKSREGIATMNGTSAMTGIGIINLIHAQNLLKWSVLASSMINEMVEAYDDYFSTELNGVKQHKGQNMIASAMRTVLGKSKLIKKRSEHLYTETSVEVFVEKVQEYYSLRCVPQILGPILDTLINVEEVLINEVNSVNDNPIIDEKNNNVFHGGNFHGDYVSMEMDKLKIAVTKLSMLAERQLNYLFNDKLNGKFPPFMNLGTLGLNFGMQGVQFTATSTVAENQTLSFPMYIHSIPNNNDNQDIVSMGTNAALLTKKVIDNSFDVLAIQFIAIIQAIDYLGIKDKISDLPKSTYNQLRAIVPRFENDTVKYPDIEKIRMFIIKNRPDIL